MTEFSRIIRADWGPALRSAAGHIAYAVAVLIVATEVTYRAGLATGRAVHWLNDRVAGLASGRIDRAETARAVVAWARATLAAPGPAPEPVRVVACTAAAAPPVAVAPPPLDALTVADLRRLARARGLSALARQGRRADLLVALS